MCPTLVPCLLFHLSHLIYRAENSPSLSFITIRAVNVVKKHLKVIVILDQGTLKMDKCKNSKDAHTTHPTPSCLRDDVISLPFLPPDNCFSANCHTVFSQSLPHFYCPLWSSYNALFFFIFIIHFLLFVLCCCVKQLKRCSRKRMCSPLFAFYSFSAINFFFKHLKMFLQSKRHLPYLID